MVLGVSWGIMAFLIWILPCQKVVFPTSPKALNINTNMQGTAGGKHECF